MSYRIEIAPLAQQEIKELPGHVRAQARVRRKEQIEYESLEPPE